MLGRHAAAGPRAVADNVFILDTLKKMVFNYYYTEEQQYSQVCGCDTGGDEKWLIRFRRWTGHWNY